MTGAIKAWAGRRNTRILGVGAYRPRTALTNADILKHLDSSDEWIRRRSGVVTRHRADRQETLAYMAVEAGKGALKSAGITADDVDLIIVATATRMRQIPHVSPEIAFKIGAGTTAAFDVSAGCAGFVYGLNIAHSSVTSGSARNVLVIGVERLLDVTDPTDRGTAFLMGDGAGAVVVGVSDAPAIGPVIWGSDGSRSDLLQQSVAWDELRESYEKGKPEQPWPSLRMQGREVFRWAVWQMADVAREALDTAGVSVAELDAFIPHQANMRITDSLVKELKLPERVVVARDVSDTGNTSAASIPLAMEKLLSSGQVSSGATALMIGFGAGLSYAGVVARLP
ncbi:beta-ketoacyl-ACP synthase III [Amycolatopsis benzoatilytica]|uniref:beta-ketoacyl-ACP synthase III n=1 Tax=Amycolatopsis benzoatilytica TaxID=346045 RepID=UPI0006864921|nr:beta-ketoacyl-ACP synthase III [Amycolatopsis benzoatilytica]